MTVVKLQEVCPSAGNQPPGALAQCPVAACQCKLDERTSDTALIVFYQHRTSLQAESLCIFEQLEFFRRGGTHLAV